MMPLTSNDTVKITDADEVVYSEGLFTSYRSPVFKAINHIRTHIINIKPISTSINYINKYTWRVVRYTNKCTKALSIHFLRSRALIGQFELFSRVRAVLRKRALF